MFSDPVAVFILMKHPFCDHKLVPILVEGAQEDGQKSNQYREQSSRIGKHFVYFAHRALDKHEFPVHAQVNQCVCIAIIFELNGGIPEGVNVVTFIVNHLVNGADTHICFNLVRSELDSRNDASFGSEG